MESDLIKWLAGIITTATFGLATYTLTGVSNADADIKILDNNIKNINEQKITQDKNIQNLTKETKENSIDINKLKVEEQSLRDSLNKLELNAEKNYNKFDSKLDKISEEIKNLSLRIK